MSDSARNVDFVLVWKTKTEDFRLTREIFETNLRQRGLLLEALGSDDEDGGIIKIHAPLHILCSYSGILGIRLPLKSTPHIDTSFEPLSGTGIFDNILKWFELDSKKFQSCTPTSVHAVYSLQKESMFQIKDSTSFPSGIRFRIVDFILKRTAFAENQSLDDVGIERLLTKKVYAAAYPLHDGKLKPGLRSLLLEEWGSLGKFYKYQPLDAVKEYMGIRVAFYFAWLGHYTQMLVPAAILGIVCFIYGLSTLYSNKHTEDICNSEFIDPMCPLCNQYCTYWNLRDTCFYARLTHSLDNDATFIFSVLMAFWAVIFLELWKRYAIELKYRWDAAGCEVEDENVRPEYLAMHGVKRRLNLVTDTFEPVLPFWRKKFPNTFFSFSMILFLSSLAVTATFGVIVYRISVTVVIMTKWVHVDSRFHSWGLIFVNTTAVIINFVFIYAFDWLYSFLAEYLTRIELHRTQTEYDDSLTLKIFLLKFINFYSSIFYIAFFKGKFAGSPRGYNYFLGYRNEECGGSGGCMTELSIQLAITMIVKQGVNTVIETMLPHIARLWKEHKRRKEEFQRPIPCNSRSQWEQDFGLLEWNSRSLVPEYLEMVIQFGFVTIFVSAFPLAPLFALINNIFEMRLDAKKLLTCYRRPIGLLVSNIGIWFPILDSLVKLAVISNAFIIAFTSNFIPKLVYRIEHETLDGFLVFISRRFNVSEFAPESKPLIDSNVTVCIYQSYENVAHEQDVEQVDFYWKVLMARLAFVVIFQNFIVCCSMVLDWVIPDVPKKIRTQISHENHIINEISFNHEAITTTCEQTPPPSQKK